MKRILFFAIAALFAVASLSAAEQSNEAKVYSRDDFVRLKKGNNIYPETDMAFHSIPKIFEGYKVTLRNYCSSEPVIFTVKEAGMVRIVVAGRPLSKLVNDGWSEIGKITLISPNGRISTDAILVLEKHLVAGDYSIPSEGNFGVRLLKK